jgi:hypothetical protein
LFGNPEVGQKRASGKWVQRGVPGLESREGRGRGNLRSGAACGGGHDLALDADLDPGAFRGTDGRRRGFPGQEEGRREREEEKEEEKKIKDKEKKKERESPDFTIELVDNDGATLTSPASRFASIPPPFKEKFTKLAIIDDEGFNHDWEVVFQTVRAPLSAFQPAGNSEVFDPSKLMIVRLKFDRTPMYKICISSIGFGKQ